MRNYKDMADAVFRRRDEYVASVKRKKKIALNASLSLCTVCLAVLGAFGIWQSGVLTPDPNVIGTKPQSFTEPTTEGLIHSIGSNATSEGEYTENTQIITGNIVTENTAIDSTNPDTSANPTGATLTTDPQEKPVGPTVKPTIPTIPAIPTLPIGPNLPNYPNAPDVPPTSGDIPKPPVVLPTDPVEPEVPAATGGDVGVEDEVPDIPTTASPTWVPVTDATEAVPDTTGAREDEAIEPTEPIEVTGPCCTQPATEPPCEEPTMPAEPETQSPTAGIKVYGKVVDQNGHPVAGAKVTLYYSSSNYSTVTTNSNGTYSFTDVPYYSGLYVKQTYAPSGYTSATNAVYINSFNDYGSNYIVFVCTKN